jgi:YHS domain-containing protein
MVELNDIEMKEIDPVNGSNTTNTTATSKDEKKVEFFNQNSNESFLLIK